MHVAPTCDFARSGERHIIASCRIRAFGRSARLLISIASHNAATRMRAETQTALSTLPLHNPAGGGSLWLERLGD